MHDDSRGSVPLLKVKKGKGPLRSTMHGECGLLVQEKSMLQGAEAWLMGGLGQTRAIPLTAKCVFSIIISLFAMSGAPLVYPRSPINHVSSAVIA